MSLGVRVIGTWSPFRFRIPRPANMNAYQPFPEREVYVCNCGCDRYELRVDGPYCGDCGTFARGWIDLCS